MERCVAEPRSSALRLGRSPRVLPAAERRSLLLWIAAVQATGLVPILMLLLLFVGRLARVVSSELQQPSDLSIPLIDRIIRDAAPALGGLLLLIALIEVLVSIASRRVIVARLGLLPDGAGERTEARLAMHGALRVVRQPLRVGAVAVLSWASALVTILIAIGSVSLAWGLTRQGLLSLERTGDLGVLLGALLLAVLLSAVWMGALCLCGLASAFRSSLWTMDTLR